MKKISEHIGVYSLQKESLFSILGRISINTTLFLFPWVLILDHYLIYFMYKWLFTIILFYHIAYGLNKMLITDIAIIGLLTLLYFLGAFYYELLAIEGTYLALYWAGFHILFAGLSVFEDYLLSDLEELSFFNSQHFLLVVTFLFYFHFYWFICFWYF